MPRLRPAVVRRWALALVFALVSVGVVRLRGKLGYAISCRPFFVLLSSLKKNRLGVGAVENCLQFSKSLVDAFFASTGTSASTPSSSARKVSVSVEATENSPGDTRARTWVDLEVGRNPDRRSWGSLIGFVLASACAIFRVSLIAGSDQTKRLAAHQPRD